MLARLARRTRRTVRLLSDDGASAVPPQRIVVAVGGNALQRRGDRLTIENMLKAAKQMVPSILALRQAGHQVLLTHGNGPQVGELALERSAATFDVLGAESQGHIGYVLAQAFQSAGVDAACIVTQTAVDAGDKAFDNPTKYVGPVYGFKEAEALANQLDWTIKQDGEYYRRVVASPKPIAVLQLDAARTLLENNYPGLVVAGGGGGAPVSRVFGDVVGVEAVVDKDATGALMARELEADGFIILTDGGGIWHNFGKPDGREMKAVTPKYLKARKTGQKFPGSMGPKISAAISFVEGSVKPNAWAIIGDLNDAAELMSGAKGTKVCRDVPDDVTWHTSPPEESSPS
jgi:carbamate kinase